MFSLQQGCFPLVAHAVEVVTKASRASETPLPTRSLSGRADRERYRFRL